MIRKKFARVIRVSSLLFFIVCFAAGLASAKTDFSAKDASSRKPVIDAAKSAKVHDTVKRIRQTSQDGETTSFLMRETGMTLRVTSGKLEELRDRGA